MRMGGRWLVKLATDWRDGELLMLTEVVYEITVV
jgi:hypothetical protein